MFDLHFVARGITVHLTGIKQVQLILGFELTTFRLWSNRSTNVPQPVPYFKLQKAFFVSITEEDKFRDKFRTFNLNSRNINYPFVSCSLTI